MLEFIIIMACCVGIIVITVSHAKMNAIINEYERRTKTHLNPVFFLCLALIIIFAIIAGVCIGFIISSLIL